MSCSTCARRSGGERERSVLVECSPDRLLAGEALRKLNIRMPVRHCGGKGRVVNALTSRYRGSVGIIDEDPAALSPDSSGSSKP